jgi:beta-aspartyl-peptidase (threonine type)
MSLHEATKKVVQEKLVKAGGSGGLIAVDKNGNISMEFNSQGMYRGYAKPGERFVGIFEAEQ